MSGSHPLDLDHRGRWYVFAGSWLDRLRGRDATADLPRLVAMERWDRGTYAAHQHQRLAELLDHCWQRAPFYRRRFEAVGLRREDLATGREALERLPPLTKAELREHGRELLTAPPERLQAASTSGSTGAPLRIWQDARFAGWSRALQRRAFLWHGVDYYEPRVFLLGTPKGGGALLRQRLEDLLIGRRLLSFHGLDAAGYEALLETIERFRPAYVTAYPSVLHDLCRYATARHRDLRQCGVRLLHCQSEMLLDHHRHSFREVFGEIPVLNEYGCVEVGAMAYSCPAGTLHVCPEQSVFEVVGDDGRPLPHHHVGRILLTPLEARGMPLLRYELGDVGSLAAAVCACGRMPGCDVLERLEGRLFEQIVGAGGERFNAGIVHFLVKRAGIADALAEYLAIQRRPGALHFLLIPRQDCGDDAGRSLVKTARELFGPDMEVSWEIVETIRRPGGKKRGYFVSEIEP